MLSFSDRFCDHYMISQNMITASLQVPVRSIDYLKKRKAGKRALLSASYARELSGSLTLEAALCLPLFLFFCGALMAPMEWLDRQRKIQTETEILCEDLSKYLYIAGKTGAGELAEVEEEEGTSWTGLLSNAAAGLWLKRKAEQYTEYATVKAAKTPDDQNCVYLQISYKEKIPFFGEIAGGVKMGAAARRRAWIGLDGKLKNGEDGLKGEAVEGTGEGEMVYVGEKMGRYHLYRDCHYLSNEYETVTQTQVKSMKNSFGGSYTECSVCRRKGGFGEMVYITPGGEHYHANQSCSAMISYVREIPLEEVESLGCCSYCSERRGE